VVPVPTGTNPEAWEAEFNFDPFEEEVKVARRWFAMAKYYSVQRSRGLFLTRWERLSDRRSQSRSDSS